MGRCVRVEEGRGGRIPMQRHRLQLFTSSSTHPHPPRLASPEEKGATVSVTNAIPTLLKEKQLKLGFETTGRWTTSYLCDVSGHGLAG